MESEGKSWCLNAVKMQENTNKSMNYDGCRVLSRLSHALVVGTCVAMALAASRKPCKPTSA